MKDLLERSILSKALEVVKQYIHIYCTIREVPTKDTSKQLMIKKKPQGKLERTLR